MSVLRLTLYALFVIAATTLAAYPAIAADQPPAPQDRFTPLAGFEVQEVVTPDATGSLVAMAFDESGAIIASRERGPLLRVNDADGDGKFESVTTFCDKVSNCQGILPLGPHVFAVGDGPAGTAFYRLSDADRDGTAEKVDTLFKFSGGMGEHGPHAPLLGPDGLIYVMIGNHAFVQPPVAGTSPHHHYYDAELITPKYEDANGHAAGIKAPGGTVIRTDTNGSFVELFVGGFRNAYDHAFNRDGELFTFDSDMEWDVGLPWYRPTRVNHLVPGAEFGWRSGWSKWPRYFVDSLPETVDIGRGSPTGVVFYDHDRLGSKYNGALFMCDWSQGRILAVTLKPADGTYAGQSETFLEGRPLNCSDIDVGPDGWLYISVGGRNTAGSILRVVTKDAAPLATATGAQGIARAIRQPQLASAWARRAVRDVQAELGDQWGPALVAVAVNDQAESRDRVRALDLMQLYGPAPANDLLVQLSRDADVPVRAKATYLLGLHPSDVSNGRLIELLDDADATVRRRACEALVRARHAAPTEKLLRLIGEPRRFVAWAARRALEQVPPAQWRQAVLDSSDVRVFVVGSVALEVLGVDRATAGAILKQCANRLRQNPSPDDEVDLLRVAELAIHQGGFKGAQLAELREQLSSRFPSADHRLNRELVRTLVLLEDPTLPPRLVEHLRGAAPIEERIQVAMLARFLTPGWTPELRSRLLEFYSLARALEGGNSYRGYLSNAANDVLKSIPPEEQLARIRDGAGDPVAALGVVQSISGKLTPEQVAALVQLDRDLAGNGSAAARELAKAVLVALGHGDAAAADYLGQVFDASPDRRGEAAQALATLGRAGHRRPADWDRLVRSLTVVEGSAARDVLQALTRFPQKNDKPQDLRQVIMLGLRLGEHGGRDAVLLLRHWTGQRVVDPRGPWQQTLAAWQKWFVEHHPNQPEPVLPMEPAGAKWAFADLLSFLTSESGTSGSAQRGALVFEKAQCVKCHRFGLRGEGIGPDLSNVASRFQRKEILESVIFPSQVISDQFAAKSVVTHDGKTYTGLVGPTADGVVVLQADTEKVNVAKDDIESVVPSKLSAMPEGLFDKLSLEEIADLFAYMAQPPASQ
jgi:putative heme-binding domain-containing protein